MRYSQPINGLKEMCAPCRESDERDFAHGNFWRPKAESRTSAVRSADAPSRLPSIRFLSWQPEMACTNAESLSARSTEGKDLSCHECSSLLRNARPSHVTQTHVYTHSTQRTCTSIFHLPAHILTVLFFCNLQTSIISSSEGVK